MSSRQEGSGAVRRRGAARRAFIGSFTHAGGAGITAASVEPGTGALTVTGATDAVPDPSFLTLGPGGSVLYAVSETENGAVAALDVASGPAPRLLAAPVPTGGSAPTHLAYLAGHVLAAHYGSGSVAALPVHPGGTLGRVTGELRHEGRGPDPERQAGPHAHQVVPAPGGRLVLAVDLGTDSVHVSALDAATGALTPREVTPLRPGSGPRHLAFHPAGSHVYVLGELEPTLAVCRWQARTGTLVPVGEVSLRPEGGPAAGKGPAYPSALAVAPDGRHVWAAVRGEDIIAVLALDEGGERLTPVAHVPCGGRWPRDLTLDPGGRRLYVANERSGDVTWFDLDPDSGVPTPAGSLAVPAATCVVLA
ncbi:lactonase family protein [Streptomyces sp. MUM 203J]|uniref:lactonase family protein n=1 Tax=Streptomyces sp. MUM 203J TaxID=2791990 RepID=UPI001F04FE00|nr:lactonase family protein [Streptomyces sp. MUM 203J]MCH0539979.1 lactonase family protein [Streptomyces sp. MUM 203J]